MIGGRLERPSADRTGDRLRTWGGVSRHRIAHPVPTA